MTHCQLLDDYLDRDLPEASRQAFAEHLHECAACREAVTEAGLVCTALADDGPLLKPASVEQIAARVQQQIQASPAVAQREATKSRSQATWAWIAAAAVLLIGVALSWQLVSDDNRAANDPTIPDGTSRNVPTPDSDNSPQPYVSETRIAQTDDTANTSGDTNNITNPNQADSANANSANSVAAAELPSLVRQVGNTSYDQIPVKSKNPKVTIVWLMEPPKHADESPLP